MQGKIRRSTACALAALLIMTIVGCAPWATYPPVEHTAALSPPTFEPIPTVTAKAIRYAQETYGGPDELVINLPEGAPQELYDQVISKLGEGRPLLQPGTPAYHVEQIRTRATEAQVDLIYPRERGLHEFVTISFEARLDGRWHPAGTRFWRVRVEPPPPRYVPEPAPAPAPPPSSDET